MCSSIGASDTSSSRLSFLDFFFDVDAVAAAVEILIFVEMTAGVRFFLTVCFFAGSFPTAGVVEPVPAAAAAAERSPAIAGSSGPEATGFCISPLLFS